MALELKGKVFFLVLLSIVVPVSLLVSFRLSGILYEPPTISETKILGTVNWSLERPSAVIDIGDNLENFYSDNEISSQCLIFITDYVEHAGHYGGNDYVAMIVNVTVTTLKGHIEAFFITFVENYEKSRIDLFEFPQVSKLENLKITNYEEWKSDPLKAFIELAGVDNPRSTSFSTPVYWVLYGSQDQHHQMNLTMEIIYFNGTTYKKLVQPFKLEIGPDNNNSFETATEIALNKTYSKFYLSMQDVDDYYKVYVKENSTIILYVEGISFPKPAFYVYLYNPEKELKVGSSKWDYSHTIVYTVDLTGYWYIHIQVYENYGFYNLTITEKGS